MRARAHAYTVKFVHEDHEDPEIPEERKNVSRNDEEDRGRLRELPDHGIDLSRLPREREKEREKRESIYLLTFLFLTFSQNRKSVLPVSSYGLSKNRAAPRAFVSYQVSTASVSCTSFPLPPNVNRTLHLRCFVVSINVITVACIRAQLN